MLYKKPIKARARWWQRTSVRCLCCQESNERLQNNVFINLTFLVLHYCTSTCTLSLAPSLVRDTSLQPSPARMLSSLMFFTTTSKSILNSRAPLLTREESRVKYNQYHHNKPKKVVRSIRINVNMAGAVILWGLLTWIPNSLSA